MFPQPEQKHIRIPTDCDADCFVVADYELLRRTLLNLILYALQETHPRTGREPERQVAGRDTLIEVEDSRPGIQDERMARIFDPILPRAAMFEIGRASCRERV